MLLQSLTVPVAEFEQQTGWTIKPEGACKGDLCIPIPRQAADQLNVVAVAQAMQMPIAEEPDAGLWALGPAYSGGRALASAKAPELELPDVHGNLFKLSSLLGQKIVVYAWAPY